MMQTIWVTLPYATFGIYVKDKIVVDAAPIAYWMKGKDTEFVRQWIAKKGGRWEIVD